MRIRGLLLAGFVALLVAACTSDAAETTSTSSPTTTIAVTIRPTPPASVTIDASVDAVVGERLEALLEELKGDVEALRGLAFLDPPRVSIHGPDEFAARYGASVDGRIDAAGLDVDTGVLRLLGLLGPGQDLRGLLAEMSGDPIAAFYDPDAGELVASGATGELGPGERSVVVRELIQVLTDQYHRHSTRLGELAAAGRFDEMAALEALREADATYFQLVYLQELSDAERAAAAEVVARTPRNLPSVLGETLTLSAETGVAFVEALVTEGGIAEVDRAYGADPLTTEKLLHPPRYFAGEPVLEVAETAVEAPGYEVVDRGTLGAIGLRSLLSEALSPGVLTQTVDGWGGDAFATLMRGDQVAWVYMFRGDDENDAIEVAQGFLDHAEAVMGMAEPLTAGGGVEFAGTTEGEAEPYLFIDRLGDGLVVVVASEIDTGRSLRDQAVVP